MLFTNEQQRVLSHRVDALDALIRSVVTPQSWPRRSAPASRYTAVFIEQLLAHLAAADGEVSLEELRLIQAVHGIQYTWSEELDRVHELSRDVTFPSRVPEFFEAACEHDRATGHHQAEQMLREIEAIIEVLVRADSIVSPDERTVWSRLLLTLNEAIATSKG